MANLQVKNVPDPLHNRLRRQARKTRCTLSEFVLVAVEKELARQEWHERLSKRSTVDLGITAADLLAQERDQRTDDLT
jgi:plasmid stability protein